MKRDYIEFLMILGWMVVSTSAAATQRDVEIRDSYSNFDYAYRVALPQGLVGFRDPAPAPNHGFGVTLKEGAYLWVDASYNSPLWDSLDAAADARLESRWEEGFGGVKQIERNPTRLGSLKAVRLVLGYVDKTGTAMAEELILAMRAPKVKGEVKIIYTIGVRVPESHRDAVEGVLQQFVRGFQLQPLP
ncbi:MAG: hypothetical protein EHM23_34565 [Acidobacteria bacterium]|nr:MAG: hypothetical protein EHM23_34565 [Acidobacteriota bacterium]